jgi:hypothetical protein
VLNQGLDVGVECKNNWLLLFSCALCKEITWKSITYITF